MPHIEQLVVQNYRVLKEVTLDELQPMRVVLGPNGSGKSTLFDVFGFLADALQTNVKKATEPRGRLCELRSRAGTGPIGITIRYRESTFGANKPGPVIAYHVAIDGRKWIRRQEPISGTLVEKSRFRFPTSFRSALTPFRSASERAEAGYERL